MKVRELIANVIGEEGYLIVEYNGYDFKQMGKMKFEEVLADYGDWIVQYFNVKYCELCIKEEDS